MSVGIKFKGMVLFDRNIIRTNWNKINEAPLRRAGLLVRKIAVQSIRRTRSPNPSPPGMPPRSRAPGNPLKLIFSVPENKFTTVVGAVGFGGATPAPGTLEHGGKVKGKLKLPDVKQRRGYRGRFKRKSFQLIPGSIRVSKHPFMGPALNTARAKLPDLWRGSLNSG
jgi:hypothetical protein